VSEVLLFHHAQGLTDGVRAFADELRAAGHAGTAFTHVLGFGTIIERGTQAADAPPAELLG
jgi:hypothetical protein